jgi:hypothetical protein
VGRDVLLEGVDHGVEVGGVDVVVDVAVGVGDAGVLGTEAPLAVHDELVLVQSARELLRAGGRTMVMENSSPCFSSGIVCFHL